MSALYEWAPYTLTAQGPLNATSSRSRFEGALVRSGGGYGCVHPWPELGDGKLHDELRSLASGEPTPLTSATRRCIDLDGRARQAGRWLFAELEVPDSHATLTQPQLDSILEAAALGYDRVKLKASPDRLKETAALLEESPLPVRLDFNSSLTTATLLEWQAALSEKAKHAIDFIEDPIPYLAETWERLQKTTGWAFAVDARQEEATHGFQVRVFKPAVEDAKCLLSNDDPFLVTSYMEHPFGQLYAAYEAARLAKRFPNRIRTCGLATHGLFDFADTTLDLGRGPKLSLTEGTGLGLDAYLEGLDWRPLQA